jgi:hypothetical protein
MRNVILVCGPPGAGKTTYAQTLGIPVYDRDDARWSSGREFREAIERLAADPAASAVVIRTGHTRADREAVAKSIGATRIQVLDTPPDVCKDRIATRGRPDVAGELEAVDRWWANFKNEAGATPSADPNGAEAAMAEDTEPNAAPTTPVVAPPAPTVPPAEPEKPLGENGEKALKAERDARKAAEKAFAEQAARLKEYEDRDKTESERQADRLATLERSNQELVAEKARYQAALEHGLSKADLALLGPGADIAERAALLAQRLGTIKPEPARLPESPNAGRESQLTDEDAEYEAFKAQIWPTQQR